MKNAFETPDNEIKCVLSVKELNSMKKWVKIFIFAYGHLQLVFCLCLMSEPKTKYRLCEKLILGGS